MSSIPFETATLHVDLKPAPIVPSWIISGNPVARAAELFGSHDGSAFTVVWECTPGSFHWHYDLDETIHVLEGAIILTDVKSPKAPKRLGPGDIIFFPKGSKVHWVVEQKVRKLAFYRHVLPKPLRQVIKLLRRGRTFYLICRDSVAGMRATRFIVD